MNSAIFTIITTLLLNDDPKIFNPNVAPVVDGAWYKPDSNTTWQWQLQGTVNTTYNVDLYDIDLFDSSKTLINDLKNSGKKVICYFSAGTYEEWRPDHSKFPQNLLGNPLDEWEGERWLDIRNEALAPIMQARLDLAVQKGCDGVEPDNVDGYTNNSGFPLTAIDQLAYNKFIANEARKRGLSVALKNDLDQIEQLEPYFDFAINEQCHLYEECSKLRPFIQHKKAVLNAEYDNKYLENTNYSRQTICTESSAKKIKTLILPQQLDDSYRFDCKEYSLFTQFNVGFGGSYSFPFVSNNKNDTVWLSSVDLVLDENIGQNATYNTILNFNPDAFNKLHNSLKNSKYLVYWLPQGWSESWFNIDKIQDAMNHGYIPVFNYWWFGDELLNGLPNQESKDKYREDYIKLSSFLNKLHGLKFLIMEPEFNKPSVLDTTASQKEFAQILAEAIDYIKSHSPHILFSLAMTDTGNRSENQHYQKCGYDNCALGDKYEWGLPDLIYKTLLDKLDFISFQEMIAQFSRDPSNPGTWDNPIPISYSNSDIGIDLLAQRIQNFSSFLFNRYHKPVFLPYIAIATATWQDSNNNAKIDKSEINYSGWEGKAYDAFSAIINNKNNYYKSSVLFGLAPMELFDNPRHDYNGYQYFLNNEYHLGIIKSGAVDEKDIAAHGDITEKNNIVTTLFNQKE